ncbi:uroporphyrinogen-III synthase [Psychrobacter sp. AOP22-C1-C5]|uniref:uroporphyrinogen-III synthase n=1 Tax=Psychrobacter sp. AOP22-C1-C5 TaxID=3457716 RepID=UPI004035B05C
MSSSTYFESTGNNQQIDKPLLGSQVVINTRPVERASPLTHYLQAAGMTVIDMPMLALQSRPITDNDIAIMQQWLAGKYKALVIVSPTAAASGLAVWQSLAREHKVRCSTDNQADVAASDTLKAPSPIIAVGDATAAALSHVRLETASYQVRQPEIANNEGMLAMSEIDSLQAGDRVLIWRGLGGRRLLVDTLQARGVHIDSIAWYERIMPIEAATQYQEWLQDFLAYNTEQIVMPAKQSKPIVVVSSGTAFEHWTQVVNQVSEKSIMPSLDSLSAGLIEYQMAVTLSDFAYVVLGERLTNMVAEQQLSHWRVDDLAPQTILAAITSKT